MTMSCLMAGAVASFFGAAAAQQYPTHEEFAMLALLNDVRARGYECWAMSFPPNPEPLVWNCALWRAAKAHSTDMGANDFFDHVSPTDGSTPGDRARRFGTTFSHENISSGREDPAEALQKWLDSGLGHCRGMMMGGYKSMGAAYVFDVRGQFWDYWTQMVSIDLPDPDTQDCLNEDGGIPALLPTPPPTQFPTVAGGAVANDELLAFEPTSWEMEVLRLINIERAQGNREACWDKFYGPSEPLVWNCGLFKAAREHLHDGVTHDLWSRTGSDGLKIADRSANHNVPYSCSDFLFKDTTGYWATPERIVQRIKSLACWAVFDPAYKSFGAGYAKNPLAPEGNFPAHGWWYVVNRHVPKDEVQTCGGGDAPVPVPTPAPTEAAPAPTPTPTDEPTDAPSAEPTEAPSAPELTDAPAPLKCKDLEAKKECKRQADCCWKKQACKDKTSICPKQKNSDKCAKFECTWDAVAETCGWIPTA